MSTLLQAQKGGAGISRPALWLPRGSGPKRTNSKSRVKGEAPGMELSQVWLMEAEDQAPKG